MTCVVLVSCFEGIREGQSGETEQRVREKKEDSDMDWNLVVVTSKAVLRHVSDLGLCRW